jgi:hypothetical protein
VTANAATATNNDLDVVFIVFCNVSIFNFCNNSF